MKYAVVKYSNGKRVPGYVSRHETREAAFKAMKAKAEKVRSSKVSYSVITI